MDRELSMFVKPSREGLIVRDPVSMQLLPADGAWKPREGYWVRRLIVGDVIEVDPETGDPAPVEHE